MSETKKADLFVTIGQQLGVNVSSSSFGRGCETMAEAVKSRSYDGENIYTNAMQIAASVLFRLLSNVDGVNALEATRDTLKIAATNKANDNADSRTKAYINAGSAALSKAGVEGMLKIGKASDVPNTSLDSILAKFGTTENKES